MAKELNVDKDRRVAFAEMLEAAINQSDRPQHELSTALGYNNSNIITMFKQGRTRVPLNKVTMLAELLGEDPTKWLRAWFETFEPEALTDIEKHMGFPLTNNEKSHVRALRKKYPEGVPRYETKHAGEAELTKAA